MTSLDALLARDAIVDRLTTLFVATDERDWPAVRDCFTPQVHFDMTSLVGGEPVALTPAQIAASWEQGLQPIQALHHQVGNFRVQASGDEATASCYGITFHWLPKPSGRNLRTFVGTYDFRLARTDGRWRISSFRFAAKFVDGNLQLEQPERPE